MPPEEALDALEEAGEADAEAVDAVRSLLAVFPADASEGDPSVRSVAAVQGRPELLEVRLVCGGVEAELRLPTSPAYLRVRLVGGAVAPRGVQLRLETIAEEAADGGPSGVAYAIAEALREAAEEVAAAAAAAASEAAAAAAARGAGRGTVELIVALVHTNHLQPHKPDSLLSKGNKYGLTGAYMYGTPGAAVVCGDRASVDEYYDSLRRAMPQKKIETEGMCAAPEGVQPLQGWVEAAGFAELRAAASAAGLFDLAQGAAAAGRAGWRLTTHLQSGRRSKVQVLGAGAAAPSKKPPQWVTPCPGGCRVTVAAKPNAKQSSLVGSDADALHVALAAPPVEGRANEELVAFLAEALALKKSAVHLDKGFRGKHKVVVLDGADPQQVAAAVAAATGGSE
eukprot:TRINITY_DN15605_c0_g2_i1.p1 TRINITY_DN15605_c0_g2~~TRINITY_DN15605_c0_g2_i1.p1  ORF type:complete len:397 (+),score=117.55 TRINITY_DN15605_c0_g2_i1:87-1277(+)